MLIATSITPAYADVYVKVDANGNAIGGAIVCDAGTCGAGSVFSQLTLKEGEQYVLQGTGTTGIGNNNPNTDVKVDIPTNNWTVTHTETVKLETPIVVNNTEIVSYTTQTKETFNPRTPVLVTPTPPTQTVDTTTATTVIDSTTANTDTTTVTDTTIVSADVIATALTKEEIFVIINNLMTKIYALLAKLGVK